MINSITIKQISILIRLFMSHIIVDFIIQDDSWIQDKNENRWKSKKLYLHSILAGILAYIFVGIWKVIWLPFLVIITHTIIDGFKSKKKDNLKNFIYDQLLHVIVLIFCWAMIFNYNFSDIEKLFSFIINKIEFWILTFSYFIIFWPTSILISKFTEPWQKYLNKSKYNGLKNAGLWIGRIERILILTFILYRHYEIIGFLIAAKSIFRLSPAYKSYSQKYIEYILLGTMLSFSIAIIIGLLTNYILY